MGEMSIQEIEEHLTNLDAKHKELMDGFHKFGFISDQSVYSISGTIIRQLLDAQKWREIETAPKDGSEIWILYPYPILEQKARWVREGPIKDMWVGSRPTWDHDEASGKLVLLPEDEWDHQTFPSSEPTHWMPIVPLPLPPLKEQGEQGDV